MNRIIPFALAMLALVAACNSIDSNNGPLTGAIKGTVLDSAGGGPLVGVRVTVYKPGDAAAADGAILHTASDGTWRVDNWPLGSGSVRVDQLPADCDSQPLLTYDLASPGTTATLTLTVDCKTSHQVVAGASDFDRGAVREARRHRFPARRVGLKYRFARGLLTGA